MIPVNKSGPATRDENNTTPLEGPISLLWAYQLRREHALLLTRVDGLAEAVRIEDAASQIKTLRLDLKTAAGRISAVEKEVDAQGLDILAIRSKASDADEALTELQLRVIESEKQQKRKNDALEAEQKSLIPQIELLKAAVATRSNAGEVTVVRDSIENMPLPTFKTPHLVRNSNVSKKIDYARPKAYSFASDLMQELEEENDKNLRTLHPFQREETESPDFNLDAGVATMSYARHGRGMPEDSMTMLPDPAIPEKQQAATTEERTELQQGCAQSWDEYLKAGRDLIRREEAAIVRSFAAGIADPTRKANCQHWLEDRAWSWENIESFSTNIKPPEASPEPASTAEPTPEPPLTREPVAPGRAADSQAVSKELARLLEDQVRRRVESLAIQQSSEPDGIRRSQRIAKQNVTVSQKAKGTLQTGPGKGGNQRNLSTIEEPPKQSRTRRKQRVNDPKITAAEVGETAPVQRQPANSKAAGQKQGVMPLKTPIIRDTSGISHTASAVKPATRTAAGRVESLDLQLEEFPDPNLREKLRKMHEIFPGETIGVCHDALEARMGRYEDACQWIADRTIQWRETERRLQTEHPSTKVKGKKDGVTPSSPKRKWKPLAPRSVATRNPQPPKTPEAQMRIGRTSYKRKAEVSEEEQVANMKKARFAKTPRKRLTPYIPIQPWSDDE